MKKNEALLILISVAVLVFLWISFSILHSRSDSTISATLMSQISAISPSFNIKVINDLKKRQHVIPVALQAPSPSPTQASESAKSISAPSASPTTVASPVVTSIQTKPTVSP